MEEMKATEIMGGTAMEVAEEIVVNGGMSLKTKVVCAVIGTAVAAATVFGVTKLVKAKKAKKDSEAEVAEEDSEAEVTEETK